MTSDVSLDDQNRPRALDGATAALQMQACQLAREHALSKALAD